MQQNFRNKSHLIRLTETQKKKARRRLIGSIFLLLIALAVLLHITSNVEPIKVNPRTIEIKNTSSNVVRNPPPVASTVAVKPTASGIAASAPAPQNSSQPAKVIASNALGKNTSSSPLSVLKLRIITEGTKPKLSPEDILNGQDSNDAAQVTASRYYVQLLASPDKDRLLKLQSILNSKGISTIIQSVDTPTGKVYRLRVGPFSNKDDADQKLDYIKSEM